MSEISELIEIARNIQNQNDEIIRLLKKIAGEDGDEFEYVVMGDDSRDDYVGSSLLDVSIGVGEAYFVDVDIFRASMENNEIVIDNLMGDGETTNFNLAELIVNESIKSNKSIDDATVILTASSKGNLPETLHMCVEEDAKKVFIPWDQMAELLYAPAELQMILKLNFYKTEEDLIHKLFGE